MNRKAKTGSPDGTRPPGGAKRGRLLWGLGLGVGVVLTFLVVRPLVAADLTGTWDLSSRIGIDRQVITVDLVQEGRTLSGTGIARLEGAGDPVRVEVRSGRVDGFDVRFYLVERGDPVSRAQEFFGTWYRDEISGKITGNAFGRRMFTGARRSPTWPTEGP